MMSFHRGGKPRLEVLLGEVTRVHLGHDREGDARPQLDPIVITTRSTLTVSACQTYVLVYHPDDY